METKVNHFCISHLSTNDPSYLAFHLNTNPYITTSIKYQLFNLKSGIKPLLSKNSSGSVLKGLCCTIQSAFKMIIFIMEELCF